MDVARFPTTGALFQVVIRPGIAYTRFETHMVFPDKNPREFMGPPFGLIVREELDLGIARTRVSTYVLVDFLRLVHTTHKIHEGKSEVAVVWRGGFVLSRIEKLLELFGAELICEGGFFQQTDKVEGRTNLRDTSGRKIGVRRWRSRRVVAVEPWWRRRGWRRKGRGWWARRRRWGWRARRRRRGR